MKRLFRVVAPLVFVLAAGVALAAAGAGAPAKHYVCAPCGLPCDAKVFDQPGACPQCGMALVEQGSAAATATGPPRKKVGILIFNGVEIIDYTGPWEVFGAANYDVYTVAASREPITTAMGMTVVPRYTFADAPAPDVVVVPGGGVKGARDDAGTLAWVKTSSAHSVHTMSVCNGAFILASAGLLDGLSATTTAGNLERLKAEFPKIRVVHDQRLVDNGRIITTGGLSAGIDGALHVVEKMEGRGTAQQVALGEEYDWERGAAFARAALADRVIPQIHEADIAASEDWQCLRTEGDREHWDLAYRGSSKLGAAELFSKVGDLLATRGKWVKAEPSGQASSTPLTSRWRFTGSDGRAWEGAMTVAPEPDRDHQYTVEIRVERLKS